MGRPYWTRKPHRLICFIWELRDLPSRASARNMDQPPQVPSLGFSREIKKRRATLRQIIFGPPGLPALAQAWITELKPESGK